MFQFEIPRMQAIKSEMNERNIKAAFLGIHEYFQDESKKDIDERRLVNDIKKINPSMVVMVICYSQILELRFLLEGCFEIGLSAMIAIL